jgi:hypothetical protein
MICQNKKTTFAYLHLVHHLLLLGHSFLLSSFEPGPLLEHSNNTKLEDILKIIFTLVSKVAWQYSFFFKISFPKEPYSNQKMLLHLVSNLHIPV